MIAPTLVGISALGLSVALRTRHRSSVAVALSFAPIFLFLGLRYNYGNDYPAYLALFRDIAVLSEMNYAGGPWTAEVGWLALNRLYAGVGFFPLVFSLAAFSCYAYAAFIKKYAPPQYYWLAIFAYFFIPENMLVQASAMRQAVAIAIFLMAFTALVEQRPFRYIFLIGIAALFHTSAILLMPMYLIGFKGISIKRVSIPLFLLAYAALLAFTDQLAEVMQHSFFAIDSDSVFNRYAVYESKGNIGSGIGVFLYGVYLTLLLLFHDAQTREGKIIFRMTIISIYLVPFAVAVSMLARLGLYFGAFSMISAPLIAFQMKYAPARAAFVLVFLLFFSWSYLQFFESPIWSSGFSEYTTIFSALGW